MPVVVNDLAHSQRKTAENIGKETGEKEKSNYCRMRNKERVTSNLYYLIVNIMETIIIWLHLLLFNYQQLLSLTLLSSSSVPYLSNLIRNASAFSFDDDRRFKQHQPLSHTQSSPWTHHLITIKVLRQISSLCSLKPIWDQIGGPSLFFLESLIM